MQKRKFTNYTLPLSILLSIGLVLTIIEIVSYRSEIEKTRAEIMKLRAQVSSYQSEFYQAQNDLIDKKPIFIFTDKQVDWKDLTPHLETIYGKNVTKNIVGTFPVPHNYNGTDITKIISDNDKIYFPSYGRFYLHTTVGFFKILLINPNSSEDEKILDIASFVSGNSVHCKADERITNPITPGDRYRISNLLRTFFASDQPLKLHCGHIATFLCYILFHQGYSVQLVQLQPENPKNGHVAMQVFLPTANKFAMIDPDHGAIVRDTAQNILSIQEIAVLVRKQPESFIIEDIANKNWLKGIYNNPEPMPNFAWTPDKSGKERALIKENYIHLMKDYTAEYWIYDEDTNNAWKPPNKGHLE